MIKAFITLLLILSPISAQTKVVEIRTRAEHQALIDQAEPMIIMFGADWCPACRRAKPEFAKAEKRYGGKVIFCLHGYKGK